MPECDARLLSELTSKYLALTQSVHKKIKPHAKHVAIRNTNDNSRQIEEAEEDVKVSLERISHILK